LRLEKQLNNYIDDMRKEDSFQGINNLVDLSVKLVETNMNNVYDLVYLLLKLVLILPVATISVERAFLMMNFVKNKLRNMMNDGLLDDCLVTLIERDILLNVKKEDIINYFMIIRRRMSNMNKKEVDYNILNFYCKLIVYILCGKKIVDPLLSFQPSSATAPNFQTPSSIFG
jgi:hypothetical protein